MKIPQWLKVTIPAVILLFLALWVRWIVQSEPPQSTNPAASFYGLTKAQMIERLGPPLSTNRVVDSEDGNTIIYGYNGETAFFFDEGEDAVKMLNYKGVWVNDRGVMLKNR